jgi:GTP-binding protein
MGQNINKPKVALIGRPNVGKSTLYNRLIGREARRGGRAAIVDEMPGVTRDRLYGVCEWDGYEFTVIDCGGIGPESEDPLWEPVAENSRTAMREADLILLIVDGRGGLTLSDDAVLKELRGQKKPVIVAVNKVDSEKQESDAYEFYKLGYEDVQFISAISGRMVGELLDLIVEKLDWAEWPEATPAFAAQRYGDTAGEDGASTAQWDDVADAEVESSEDEYYPFAWAEAGQTRFTPDESWRNEPIRLVFVGRQNVGKSSLTNLLLGEHRSLVAELAGTTRDPLYAEFERDGQKYQLLDTAGMKRISRLKESVDYYSLIRAEKSLRGSEVSLLVIDAESGVVEQDKRVASRIAEAGRSVVVLVNKADLLPEGAAAAQAYERYVRQELARLPWAELLFTSAVEGRGIGAMLAAAVRARENFHRRIDNSALQAVLHEAITLSPPPIVKNRELRFFDFRQIGNCPPTFLVELNEKKCIRQAYRRFLANTVRKHFNLSGTHIEMVFYEKRKRKR